MKKPVIMVWCKTDSGTHPNGSIKSYGLGDLLRGTIYLYQQSLKFGFNFMVDIRMHPISKYLMENTHSYIDYVNANLNKMQIMNCHECDNFNIIYNASLHNDDPLLICTNIFCDVKLTMECKQFMKMLLTPNENFANYINQQNSLHGVSVPYSIIHVRLGDDEFVKDKRNMSTIEDVAKIIKEHAVPSDILITNSFRLKEHVKSNQPGIAMFNTRPMHLGELSTIFGENVSESFEETLYEFFSLRNSSNIKTYSVYDWVSGFVKFASIIYDIPLFDLKQLQSRRQIQLKPEIKIQSYAQCSDSKQKHPPMTQLQLSIPQQHSSIAQSNLPFQLKPQVKMKQIHPIDQLKNQLRNQLREVQSRNIPLFRMSSRKN
jgi:hypothetical protein